MQALPVVVYILLVQLTVGGFFILLLTDLRREVSPGFLSFTALLYLILGGLGYWLRQGLGQVEPTSVAEGIAFAIFLGGLLLYTVLVSVGPALARWIVGALALVAGAVSLAGLGIGAALPHGGGFGTPIAFFVSALSLGAVTSGMLLGHWYLVTPSLSTKPLKRMVALLAAALVVQIALAPVFLGVLGDWSTVQTALGQPTVAFLVGLRFLVGLIFSLVLAVLTWQCTKTRALQSATGLLYVALATVAAGEISARMLFFMVGLPV